VLLWLIDNNPLYRDLDKTATLHNSKEYPDYGCPLAVKEFMHTNSANNQSASYTSYSDQANAELFDSNNAEFELTSTTLVDADNINATYRQRKLEALRLLKNQQLEFVKLPSGNVPLSTSKNPKVFGLLWPTLFPYGVRMVDNDDVRVSEGYGFHTVDTATHVQHLLIIGDCRFQLYKSFIFVLNNHQEKLGCLYPTL
jgi:hypothetical protein